MHLYAYAGFPRSLNALGTNMKVVEARKSQGKEDIQGEIADPFASPEDSLALLKKQVSLEASQNVIKALQ
ncbi:hypothetical protein [Glaciecola sp. 1036]|uniref:hypothetical protein n=1 Tax=Alteromonadaceae TaxID=72275 RepID=UPI003D05FB63